MNYQIISMAFLMMIGLACEMALEEMVKIARKTTNRVISR